MNTAILGQPVELSRLDQELQQLFLDSSEEVGITRASLLNLALYNENQEQLEEDCAALEAITRESACRALLIHTDPRGGEVRAQSWIQAHCQVSGSGTKQVCTEQVSFLLEGRAPGMVRNIVFAHLDSDLPLALWWRGEFSDVFEESLYSRVDRLLFDSEDWETPRNQFLRLQDAQDRSHDHLVLHDLSFTRLNPVREAIANAFDRPRADHRLESLERIEIRSAPHHRMSAIYLANWIAERLGARLDPAASTADRFVFLGDRRRSEGPGSFAVSLGGIESGRKGCVEVDFHLAHQRIEISRRQSRDFLRTRIHDLEQEDCEEHWLPNPGSSDADLVTQILIRAGRNRAYSRILPQVGELLAV